MLHSDVVRRSNESEYLEEDGENVDPSLSSQLDESGDITSSLKVDQVFGSQEVALSDLPHPSKLRRRRHISSNDGRPFRKKYSLVDRYHQQLKRKQSEFNWISDLE